MKHVRMITIKVFNSDNKDPVTFNIAAGKGKGMTEDGVQETLVDFKTLMDEKFPGNSMSYVRLSKNRFNLVHA